MTEEQKRNLELACQALEANPKKAKGAMRDNNGGRCCLAVMADVACEIKGLQPGELDSDEFFPRASLSEVFGIPNAKSHDTGEFSFTIYGNRAEHYNDGSIQFDVLEKNHVEIAAMIRGAYLKD